MRVSFSQDQSLINEEIQKMLSKGVITKLHPEEADQGFLLSLFLVLKKNGGMGPVMNLKILNECVVPQHFKMVGIYTKTS